MVGDNKCNEGGTFLDLSSYKELRIISIGDNSFSNVNELHIEGLTKLENVTIGMNSFTQYKNSYRNYGYYSSGKFYRVFRYKCLYLFISHTGTICGF